jgi:hypothetical protein
MQNCLNDHPNNDYKQCRYCKLGFEKIGACPQSMLTPKDEGIARWLNFLKYIFLDISYFLYTLDVGILFGRQDVLT